MPQNDKIQCPHELRPGIKVCYHCVHDRRVAAAARRVAAAKRVGAVVLALVVVAAVGGQVIGGSGGLDIGRSENRQRGKSGDPEITRAADLQSGKSGGAGGVAGVIQPVSTAEVHAAVSPPVEAALAPVIPEGSIELPGGFSATRVGDTVTVSFDTQMLRTRRPAKFEEIVRSSLPGVYGAQVESALSNIPRGSLVQEQDLFAELPTRGLRIALATGATLALWPQTKERADGPLVVAYRATVSR